MSPKKRPARPGVSSPLPLPISFALLPSLLPTKTLSPLLYTEINGLPIYLTLLPTHAPHVSFLPLLISLFPTSPLHLIKLLHPSDYSRDLEGNAPCVDIWLPLPKARQLCEALGVARLFWDDARPHAGLMGRQVDGMISWEADHAMCHNWLPSANSIPTSSYSLDRLLSTPFGGIDIIPDDCYILTVCDPARKARLAREAESADHTRIRHGQWGEAWEGYIKLAGEVWAGYAAYPSKPPVHCPLPVGLTLADAQLIDLYSRLTNTIVSPSTTSTPTMSRNGVPSKLPLTSAQSKSATSSSCLAYPLTSADILACIASPSPPSFSALLVELLTRLSIAFLSLPLIRSTPFRRPRSASRAHAVYGNGAYKMDPADVQRRCRIQLSLVELIGALLVDKMATALSIARLERQVQSSDEVLGAEKEIRVVMQAKSKLEELYPADGRSPPQQPSVPNHGAWSTRQDRQSASKGMSSDYQSVDRYGQYQHPERSAASAGRLKTAHTNGQSRYSPDTEARMHTTRARLHHQRVHSIDETGSDTSSSNVGGGAVTVDPLRLSVSTSGFPASEGVADEMKRLERQRGGSPASTVIASAPHHRPAQALTSDHKSDQAGLVSSEDDDMTPTGNDRRNRTPLRKRTAARQGAGSAPGSRFSFGKATKRAEEKDGDIWDPESGCESDRASTCRQTACALDARQSGDQEGLGKMDRRRKDTGQDCSDAQRRRKAADMLDPGRAHIRAQAASASTHEVTGSEASELGAAKGVRAKVTGLRRRSDGAGSSGPGSKRAGEMQGHSLSAVFEEDDDDNEHDPNNHMPRHLSDAKGETHSNEPDEDASTIQHIADEALDVAHDTVRAAMDNMDDLLRPVKMRSEELGNAWMYYSLVAAVVGAVVLGWVPLT